MAGSKRARDPHTNEMIGRATALIRSGRPLDAVRAFQQILPKIKNDSAALHQYAIALYEAGDYDNCVKQFRALLKKHPMDARLRGDFGTVLIDVGKPDEAIAELERALAISPDLEPLLLTRATAMRRLGRTQDAEQWLAGLASNPMRHSYWLAAASIHIALARESSQEFTDRAMQMGTAALSDVDDKDLGRMLLFQLAELSDKRGEYGRAFEYAVRANAARRTEIDCEARTKAIESMAAEWRSAQLKPSPPAAGPIFIVGMPRSGTSLVEQILGAHRDVAAGGEQLEILHSASRAGVLDQGFGFVRWSAELASHDLSAEAQAVDSAMRRRAGNADAKRTTDKLPSNILRVGYIKQLFPAARIIVCQRDPRDTVLSCFFQDFPPHLASTFDLGVCAHDLADTRRLAQTWATVFPDSVRIQSYERLVDDPEQEIRGMLEFLGLEFDESCLRHHEQKQHVLTQSYDQANRPIYKKSSGRWKNYAEHIGEIEAVFKQRGIELPTS